MSWVVRFQLTVLFVALKRFVKDSFPFFVCKTPDERSAEMEQVVTGIGVIKHPCGCWSGGWRYRRHCCCGGACALLFAITYDLHLRIYSKGLDGAQFRCLSARVQVSESKLLDWFLLLPCCYLLFWEVFPPILLNSFFNTSLGIQWINYPQLRLT